MCLENIKFRNARAGDISDIMKVEHSSFSEGIGEGEAVFAERIRCFPEGFRVMKHDDKIIGYISSEIWSCNDSIKDDAFLLGHSISSVHDYRGTELYISSMGMFPSYRGHSLGRYMFENFIEYIKLTFPGLESVILIVSESWSTARKIYDDNGFNEINRIDNFFNCENKENYCKCGIVMRKKLV